VTRGVDDLLADLAEAADAAAELVGLGKNRWDTERPLRLAGEAVIGRLGDIATKLPDEIIKGTPEIPWREVKGMRSSTAGTGTAHSATRRQPGPHPGTALSGWPDIRHGVATGTGFIWWDVLLRK